MSNMLEHVAYLSQTIGPRPAGTEEEQQAAFYIAEQFQQEADLPASIEDFDGTGGYEAARVLCAVVTLLAAVLSLVFDFMAIPALVLTIASALLLVAEIVGKPVLSNLLKRGVSQNVVARYEPAYSAEAGGTRRRKIVLVAHYDSGKTKPQMNGPLAGMQALLKKVSLGGAIAVPVLLLIKNLFFLHAEGATAIVMTVLVVIAVVLSSLPLVGALVSKTAAYNDAANCNASGVAVLLEVASRVSQGSKRSFDDDFASPQIHGERAVRDAGLVPEGAELIYEEPRIEEFTMDPQSPEARLAAAKAAVAALTGRPVSTTVSTAVVDRYEQMAEREQNEEYAAYADEAYDDGAYVASDSFSLAADEAEAEHSLDSFELSSEDAAEQIEQAAAGDEAAQDDAAFREEDSFESDTVEGFSNVPDWFKKAQEKAKKPTEAAPSAYRSRYADALDAAMSESSAHFAQANETVELTVEQRLQRVRESIMDVKAPEIDRDALAAAVADSPETAESHTPVQAEQNHSEAVPTASAVQPEGVQPAVQQPAVQQPVAQRALFIPSLVLQQEAGATQSMPPLDVTKLRAELSGSADAPSKPRVASLPSLDAQPSSEAGARAVNGLLASLPAIDSTAKSEEGKREVRDLSLPSLSGASTSRIEGASNAKAEDVSSSGMPKGAAALGSTVAFAPVTEELMEHADASELYVDDVADDAYGMGYGDGGAFADSDYVEMPKSRLQRLFGRFGRKKKEREISAQEWLDVDEDFDARSVGAARGSWESFRDDEQGDYGSDDTYDGYDAYDENADDADFNDYFSASDERQTSRKRRWHGGMYADEGYDAYDDGVDYDDAYQKIERFYHANINTEVWFVALGSELTGNNGMRAFLKEHAQDLRGAVIVELEALGAGNVCLVDSEGAYVPAKASSRMKRYAKKAASATGMSLGSTSLLWNDSASSYAIRQGAQAMHLVGMDGAKPAFYGQGDDVLENIDEETLYANADFVLELLKSI